MRIGYTRYSHGRNDQDSKNDGKSHVCVEIGSLQKVREVGVDDGQKSDCLTGLDKSRIASFCT